MKNLSFFSAIGLLLMVSEAHCFSFVTPAVHGIARFNSVSSHLSYGNNVRLRSARRTSPEVPPALRMLLDDGEDGGEEERIPGSQIAKEIEAGFVVACTQMGSSYQEGLTAFVEAVLSAYEEGYSVPSMALELSSCPQQTAGRPLQADEVELRQVWISLVYLTLQTVAHPRVRKDSLSISTPFEDKFLGFVRNIVQAHSVGSTLERMKLEEVMNRKEGEAARNPMESAILSQAMRIVFVTLDVLKREKEEDAAKPEE